MEAKDTVMDEVNLVVHEDIARGNTIDITEELVAQAEISFKAGYEQAQAEGAKIVDNLIKGGDVAVKTYQAKGYRAGIREVVEWMGHSWHLKWARIKLLR